MRHQLLLTTAYVLQAVSILSRQSWVIVRKGFPSDHVCSITCTLSYCEKGVSKWSCMLYYMYIELLWERGFQVIMYALLDVHWVIVRKGFPSDHVCSITCTLSYCEKGVSKWSCMLYYMYIELLWERGFQVIMYALLHVHCSFQHGPLWLLHFLWPS